MSETVFETLLAKITRLEEANAAMAQELTTLRAQQGQQTNIQKSTAIKGRSKSRRRLLRTGLGAATVVAGAGALLEMTAGAAQAASVGAASGPGTFTSNHPPTPAVSATGTKGADGVIATSDSGVGVLAQSSQGPAIMATNAALGSMASATSQAVRPDSGSPSVVLVEAVGGHNGIFVSQGNDAQVSIADFTGNGVAAFSRTGPALIAQNISSIGGPYAVRVEGEFGTQASSAPNIGFEPDSGGGFGGLLSTAVHGNAVVGLSQDGVGVIAQSNKGTALQIFGSVYTYGSHVGQVKLPTGKTTIKVVSAAATTSSNVLLTPLADPGGALWVTRAQGAFTIHISKALSHDLDIAYLIIN